MGRIGLFEAVVPGAVMVIECFLRKASAASGVVGVESEKEDEATARVADEDGSVDGDEDSFFRRFFFSFLLSFAVSSSPSTSASRFRFFFSFLLSFVGSEAVEMMSHGHRPRDYKSGTWRVNSHRLTLLFHTGFFLLFLPLLLLAFLFFGRC